MRGSDTLRLPKKTPLNLVRLDRFNTSVIMDVPPIDIYKISNAYDAIVKRIDFSSPSCGAPADEIVQHLEKNGASELRRRLETTFSEIKKRPFNNKLMAEAACILQSLSKIRGTPSGARMRIPRAPGRVYGQGIEGAVVDGKFENPYAPLDTMRDPHFVMKVSVGKNGLYNEAVNGIFAVNKLRTVIPTFTYTYGVFNAHSSTVNRNNVTLFNGLTSSLYLMMERLDNARTFFDFYLDSSIPISAKYEVYCQTLLALAVAAERIEFSHGDLHDLNRLVQKLPERRTFAFPVGGKTYYVESQYLLRIIDYGIAHTRASVSPSLIPTGTTEIDNIGRSFFVSDERGTSLLTGIFRPSIQMTPYFPIHLSDAARSLIGPFRNAGLYREWAEILFYRGIKPLAVSRNMGKPLPINMQIDILEFFERGLARVSFPLRVSTTLYADYAQLFSCEEDACV